jgi:hypothetical protein
VLLAANFWSPLTRDLAIQRGDMPRRRAVCVNIARAMLFCMGFVVAYRGTLKRVASRFQSTQKLSEASGVPSLHWFGLTGISPDSSSLAGQPFHHLVWVSHSRLPLFISNYNLWRPGAVPFATKAQESG